MTYIYTKENDNCFYHWLESSDNYKNNHSYDGAKAIFEYYESLAEDTNEPIEFDPIAWCCEWNEYESIDCETFLNDYPDYRTYTIEHLKQRTLVISEEPLVFLAF
jgi:hypothetical protein